MAPMLKFHQINPTTVRVDKIVKLKEGRGVLVKLVQENGNPIAFQSPLMPLAWTTTVKTQSGGVTSCGLPLSFDAATEKTQQFSDWLDDFRDHLKKLVVDNSVEWYGKALTEAQVEEYFSAIIRDPPADTQFAATFIPKIAHIATDDGNYEMQLKVYNVNEDVLVPEEALKKGAKCAAKIKFPYIHLGKGNKMISVRADVVECLALPPTDTEEFSFDLEDDPELKAALEAAKKKRKVDVPADEEGEVEETENSAPRTEMADHDDEEDV